MVNLIRGTERLYKYYVCVPRSKCIAVQNDCINTTSYTAVQKNYINTSYVVGHAIVLRPTYVTLVQVRYHAVT